MPQALESVRADTRSPGAGGGGIAAAVQAAAGQQAEPMALLMLEVLGRGNEASRSWLRRGLTVWINAGGDVGLERCLRLPATAARLRIAQRDYHLARLAQSVDAASPWKRAELVAQLLADFQSRGRWAQGWRNLNDPPCGAGARDVALFFACKANRGRPISARQVLRILGGAAGVVTPIPAEMSEDMADDDHIEANTQDLT